MAAAAAEGSVPFGVGDRILIQGRHIGLVKFLGEADLGVEPISSAPWLWPKSTMLAYRVVCPRHAMCGRLGPGTAARVALLVPWQP